MNASKPIIRCRSCDEPFTYRRTREYSWLSSRRCPLCGDEHDSSAALERMIEPDTDTDGTKELYLMYDGQRVKVGISNNVERRVSELQIGNPDITLMRTWTPSDARSTERVVHARLDQHHVDGEWFNCSPSDAQDVVEDVMADVNGGEVQMELDSWRAVA